MKKIIAGLASLLALSMLFVSCGGGADPVEGPETFNLSITSTTFANENDKSVRNKDSETGEYYSQAQFSILDESATLPVKGDVIKVTLNATADTAFKITSGDENTYAYLASSTDGTLESGVSDGWWTVLSDEAALTIDGTSLSLEAEFTLKDGCAKKSTMTYGSQANALMLVIGYKDADADKCCTETLTFDKLEVINNKQ